MTASRSSLVSRASRPLARSLGYAALLSASLWMAAPASAQNAAVVNGKAIPSARVDEFVKMLEAQGRPDTPELRKHVRDELIVRELFIQEADKRGLSKEKDVKQQLEQLRQDVLIRALIANELKKAPVTEAEVKAEYDRLVKDTANGNREYKARHILVENEADAKKIIESLKNGEKFEELAKQSKDPGSGANGGDLGWNTPETFVKEFSDGMVALKKGEYTQAPIKSQFGYHVIMLDDVRDAEPPAFEQIRPQLQQQLERQKIQALQDKLRASAKIK
ncbi:MAG: peptidylprolyl isomerase [Lautropia sp.]|nr:peptidylprolyl isomerase [Lautropia sp.]